MKNNRENLKRIIWKFQNANTPLLIIIINLILNLNFDVNGVIINDYLRGNRIAQLGAFGPVARGVPGQWSHLGPWQRSSIQSQQVSLS